MKFDILTLFPEMVQSGLNDSILKRAVENNIISINTVNIRNFTNDKHGHVDDYPYGGGAGMIMQAQPIYDAYMDIVKHSGENFSNNLDNKDMISDKNIRTVYVTPQGKTFNQRMAHDFAKEEEIIILCGHYEGIDERVIDKIVTDRVSIGDYVLTGGELAAMVIVDSVSRLVQGVLHNDNSSSDESFENGLLEYPQYSRPSIWNGKEVPEILLSGDHKKVDEWRRKMSLLRTKKYRPDLFSKYELSEKDKKLLEN